MKSVTGYSHFATFLNTPHPNIFNFLEKLNSFQALISLKINSIKKGEQAKMRKRQRKRQEIWQLAHAYFKDGNISTTQYIKRMSFKF